MLRYATPIKRIWIIIILLCAFDVMRRPNPTFLSVEREATTSVLIRGSNTDIDNNKILDNVIAAGKDQKPIGGLQSVERVVLIHNNTETSDSVIATVNEQTPPVGSTVRCAVNFFGLPRAFESLVLPSIVKNIVAVNPDCDYYVHYYHTTSEAEGRSGKGGVIDPTAVLLLRDAVQKEAIRRGDAVLPIVEFTYDKEEDFWTKYSDLIEKIRTTKVDGKYLYFPWAEKSYRHPETTDNIVKMWHTIQSSFELMEKFAASNGIEYDIVGMFRSDVVYVTPINIRDAPKPSSSNELVPVTITDFGNFPVSDRMIYGPRDAVKAWATQRFSRLDNHVDFMLKNDPGWGMHSEKFVYHALFPLIKQITTIRPHPTLCFFRARADESVWVSDCSNDNPSIAAPSIKENMLQVNRTFHDVVQDAIGRPCSASEPEPFSTFVLSLPCRKIVGNITDDMVAEKNESKSNKN